MVVPSSLDVNNAILALDSTSETNPDSASFSIVLPFHDQPSIASSATLSNVKTPFNSKKNCPRRKKIIQSTKPSTRKSAGSTISQSSMVKVLFWNCRRISNTPTRRHLRHLGFSQNPDFIFPRRAKIICSFSFLPTRLIWLQCILPKFGLSHIFP